MSEQATETDVNDDLGEDRVTDDHQAGIGPSADELEHHNLDFEDFDAVVAEIEGAGEETEEESGATETTDESESEASESSEEEEAEETPGPVPYDRFKEINDKANQQAIDIARLEGRLEVMQAQPAQPEVPVEAQPLPLDDVLGLEGQQILDAFQADPADFLGKLQERSTIIAQQQVSHQQEEERYYQGMKVSLDAFAADHEDFMPNMTNLVGMMQTDPKHNVVSAYYEAYRIPALQKESDDKIAELETQLTTAKEEGIKEGRAKVIAEIRAKGSASTLDGSSSTQGGKPALEPELEDTEKSGGLRKLLTEKLIRKREAS